MATIYYYEEIERVLRTNRYYRRFVLHYGIISKPLTKLLKKDKFQWSPTAEMTFIALKEAMSRAPILAIPNSSKPFVVEIDANDMGMGAMVMQEGRLLAYFS